MFDPCVSERATFTCPAGHTAQFGGKEGKCVPTCKKKSGADDVPRSLSSCSAVILCLALAAFLLFSGRVGSFLTLVLVCLSFVSSVYILYITRVTYSMTGQYPSPSTFLNLVPILAQGTVN